MENRLLLPPAPAACRLPSAVCRLLLPRCHAIKRSKVRTSWLPIIEAALHFPAPKIELPPCATIETSAVGLTLARKRPTHFPVPTAKKPRYPAASPAPRRIVLDDLRLAFDDCILRLHSFNLSKVPKNCLHYANAQKTAA